MSAVSSPEDRSRVQRPRFNSNPESLFTGGLLPIGYRVINTDPAGKVLPLGNDGPVLTLTVTTAGTGLTPTGVSATKAATALTGRGAGLTLTLTVSGGGSATAATVVAGGEGFAVGDTVSVADFAGVVLTVATITSL
jgi:hypothetical protein